MTDEQLREIERNIEAGRLLPGRDLYALETMAALVAEVRRRGVVITQMQQAIDYAGDIVPEGDEEDARAFTKRYLQVIKHQG